VSDTKQKFKADETGDYLSNLVFKGLIRSALLLPYETRVRFMGKVINRFISPLAGWRKRIRDNLSYVMPELSPDEVKQLTRAVPDTVGRMIIEMYSGKEYFDRLIDADITGDGLEAMIQAHNDGRPLILVTGHYANYVAIGPALKRLGITIGVLYRPMENRFFNDHYVDAISYFSDPQFPQTKLGIVQMVRHIRKGGAVGILTDVHAPEGARTQFMGKPAATSTIISELAIKNDALMVPIYGVRQPNGLDFKVEVHAPIELSDATTMTQQINDDLEAMVRRHPEQWFWVHKRWKIS
jgi:Kdo2-lipid IVA lauroyltransferase/acyltransferase